MRYIDADALRKETERKIKANNEYGRAVVDDEFLDLIDDAFTEDVVEVRHGEWVFGKLGGRGAWVCSLCGAGFAGENAEWIAKEHDFCPKCGAKMDGERREHERQAD